MEDQRPSVYKRGYCVIPPLVSTGKWMSENSKKIFGYLVGSMDENRMTDINNSELSRLTGINVRSIRTIIQNFEMRGYITRQVFLELGSVRYITIQKWVLT